MNWSYKFAFDEIEEIVKPREIVPQVIRGPEDVIDDGQGILTPFGRENHPWIMVDGKIQQAEPDPERSEHEAFVSMQNQEMMKRHRPGEGLDGFKDWFAKTLRGRYYPNLRLTTVTTINGERDSASIDPPLDKVKAQFPGAALVSFIGGTHLVPGTGVVDPNIVEWLSQSLTANKWHRVFEKTAMVKAADEEYSTKIAMDMEGLKKMLMAAWGITAVGLAGGTLAWLLDLGVSPQQLEQQLRAGATQQDVMRQVSPQNVSPEAPDFAEDFPVSAPLEPEMQENAENVGFLPNELDNVTAPDNIEQLPRGIRNNNPGNLERNETQWNGASDDQQDERFVTFESPEYGVRAMARVLRNYQRKHGLRTIADIVGRWAPSAENDTDSYIQHVSDQIGTPPNSPLDLEDDALLARLIIAIIRHENGRNFYDDATIQGGISLEKQSSGSNWQYKYVKMDKL